MKTLVIGCGSVGRRHAANARKFGETAVFDVDRDLAARTASELGIESFANLEDALARSPSRAIVAVPNRLHIPLAEKAVAAGADVLIEKPVSHTTEGVGRFLDRAEASGRRVVVGCNMRFHKAVAALHENLAGIGRPFFARAHVGNYLPNMRPGVDYRKLYCARREEGGGVILDAIHEIDYLSWFFGPVERVTADAARLSDLEIDVEDYACLGLRHASGPVSELHLDYLRPWKRRGCEIVGSQGMLLWQSEGKQPEICTVRLFQQDTGTWDILLETDSLDVNQPYETMLSHFMEEPGGSEGSPLLGGREALAELEVALQALAAASSANTGR